MTQPDRTDAAITSLRQRQSEMTKEHRDLRQDIRFVAAAIALAVALPVLTATTWFLVPANDDRDAFAATPWHLPEEIGWQGPTTLVLLLLLVATSLVATAAGSAGRRTHWLIAALGAVTAVFVLLLPMLADDHTKSAPGLWLSLLALLALSLTHGVRGDVLDGRRRSD